MYIVFSEEELEWIDKETFGWPIKPRCPKNVKKRIEIKKKTLDDQMRGVFYGDRIQGKQR